jgi:hypothetical protein
MSHSIASHCPFLILEFFLKSHWAFLELSQPIVSKFTPLIFLHPNSLLLSPPGLYFTMVNKKLHSSAYGNIVTVSLPFVENAKGKPAASMSENPK